MRVSTTWLYYGVGIICLGVSIWLVVSPPAKGRSNRSVHDQATGNVGPDRGLPPFTGRPTGLRPGQADQAAAQERDLAAPHQPPADLDAQKREAWIDNYCEQLAEASYLDDVASLELLLAELGSAELKIAESAYRNLMARHDRRAIPYLEKRIEASTSAFEKKHLLELVDFLQTKSIAESDLLRKRKGQ